MIVQVLMAALATLGLSILFATPKRHWLICSLVGGGGFYVYLAVIEATGNMVLGCFVATLTLVVMARAIAVVHQAPVTVFLLAGIFPLVPGAGIYYTAYYLFTSDPRAGDKGLETVMLAGAIVLGILFGFALPTKFFSIFQKIRFKASKG